ncbi:hypothetical protein ZHAS_00004866 [Anopheles sinensis]|uniref:Uncharacterized protein n=1 Tax=Anopheles sinensis TaxID=74873 RepID=A0A084VI35_ANOSI|nr:hypothetical protein ZHAS_00004866 [Anopheles sinensis]
MTTITGGAGDGRTGEVDCRGQESRWERIFGSRTETLVSELTELPNNGVSLFKRTRKDSTTSLFTRGVVWGGGKTNPPREEKLG